MRNPGFTRAETMRNEWGPPPNVSRESFHYYDYPLARIKKKKKKKELFSPRIPLSLLSPHPPFRDKPTSTIYGKKKKKKKKKKKGIEYKECRYDAFEEVSSSERRAEFRTRERGKKLGQKSSSVDAKILVYRGWK